MQERKIYAIGGGSDYHARWAQGVPCSTMEEADLVIGRGGNDVDWRLYTDHLHPNSWGFTPKETDSYLFELRKAIELKKPIWGICKGLQYLCVLAGGILIQDISHPSQHLIQTEDGDFLMVNSMHHQMCYPFNISEDKYRILAWANNISPIHQDGEENEMPTPIEPEMIHFSEINGIGSQFHPESMSEDSPALEYCRDILNKFLTHTLQSQLQTA